MGGLACKSAQLAFNPRLAFNPLLALSYTLCMLSPTPGSQKKSARECQQAEVRQCRMSDVYRSPAAQMQEAVSKKATSYLRASAAHLACPARIPAG